MATELNSEPSSTTFTLGRSTVLHLASDLSASALQVDRDAWANPAEVAQFQEGRVMSVFEYGSTWTWWERHPTGVEMVHVLSGSLVFHLEGFDTTAVALTRGDSLLVPENVWHTAEIVGAARMLFVTPLPARTEHRPVQTGLVDKVSHG